MAMCKYGFYSCQFVGSYSFCVECFEGSNYQMKSENRGGKRPGSGRPKKGYRTVTVAFRVREEIAEPFKIHAKNVIKRLTATILDKTKKD